MPEIEMGDIPFPYPYCANCGVTRPLNLVCRSCVMPQGIRLKIEPAHELLLLGLKATHLLSREGNRPGWEEAHKKIQAWLDKNAPRGAPEPDARLSAVEVADKMMELAASVLPTHAVRPATDDQFLPLEEPTPGITFTGLSTCSHCEKERAFTHLQMPFWHSFTRCPPCDKTKGPSAPGLVIKSDPMSWCSYCEAWLGSIPGLRGYPDSQDRCGRCGRNDITHDVNGPKFIETWCSTKGHGWSSQFLALPQGVKLGVKAGKPPIYDEHIDGANYDYHCQKCHEKAVTLRFLNEDFFRKGFADAEAYLGARIKSSRSYMAGYHDYPWAPGRRPI